MKVLQLMQNAIGFVESQNGTQEMEGKVVDERFLDRVVARNNIAQKAKEKADIPRQVHADRGVDVVEDHGVGPEGWNRWNTEEFLEVNSIDPNFKCIQVVGRPFTA